MFMGVLRVLTTVLPAASAGAIFLIAMSSGWFHLSACGWVGVLSEGVLDRVLKPVLTGYSIDTVVPPVCEFTGVLNRCSHGYSQRFAASHSVLLRPGAPDLTIRCSRIGTTTHGVGAVLAVLLLTA
jgi:hypothetical protein